MYLERLQIIPALVLSGCIALATGSLFADGDLETVYTRRVRSVVAAYYNPEVAIQLRNELTPEGNWTDVDYTSGCPARRANWPAQDHFHKIITMASSWHEDQGDFLFLEKISLALDYWFDRDFTEDDCINAGGQDARNCPCGTPGMWNTNWYGQMILIPSLVSSTCLILKSNLTATQFSNCTTIMSRAYARIDGDPNGSMGPMTGANLLDVASTGMSLALLISNETLLQKAITRIYNECQITLRATDDGIKVDGSYMQHDSQLYTGNYGKVFMNNMLKIFLETSNTSAELAPPPSVQSAFLTLMSGSEWFIYLKNKEGDPFSPILSWQYSVIGRMVSHKYEDWRGIDLVFDRILEATQSWENHADFEEIIDRLASPDLNVNPGALVGTRFFHISDYLVHRGPNYIVGLKMFSSRTTNSECNNAQNPFGFHLSDGAIYTYINGNEYTNVYGAWDWDLIPGTTVDHEGTSLSCGRVQFKGLHNFVGGAALGHTGIAVMQYSNPFTRSLSWTKTYFFFPNAYVVQFVGDVKANNSSPVYTTLEQKQRSGPIYIDGELVVEPFVRTYAQKIWHDRVGYEFMEPVRLTVDTRERQSNWSAIGISVGNETQRLVAVYFEHPLEQGGTGEEFTYVAHLDIDQNDFEQVSMEGKKNIGITPPPTNSDKKSKRSLKQMAVVRGATYGNEGGNDERVISLAFLTPGDYDTGLGDITRAGTDAPVLLIFQRNNFGWTLGVSDPTQMLTQVRVNVYISPSETPVELTVGLPGGPWAGSTTVVEL